MVKKIENWYQIFLDLVKRTWKKSNIARDIISDLFSRLRSHINANKKKSKYCISIFQAIDKYLRRVYYKRFFKIYEVMDLNKVFWYVGTILWQYKGFFQVIAIWVINNFTVHWIFNVCIRVFSNSYIHHTTNNFEWLIEKKGLEITFIIMTLILTMIGMHITSTRFLEACAIKVVFNIDRKIPKRFVTIKKICAKLIFAKYISLDWKNNCKFKTPLLLTTKITWLKWKKKIQKPKLSNLKTRNSSKNI